MTKFIAWTILQSSVSKNAVRVRVCNTQVSTRFSYKCKHFLLVFNIFLLILLSIPSLPEMQQMNKICYCWLSLSYWNKNCQLDLTANTAAHVIFTEYSLKFLIFKMIFKRTGSRAPINTIPHTPQLMSQ